MPTLVRYFDPILEMGVQQSSVDDLDDAIEMVLADEQWVHDTTDKSATCITIVMFDEIDRRLYLYVEFPNSGTSIPSPQIDTYELTN